jgi:hypothetical protein
MYFVLVIGTIELIRWMAYVASSLVSVLARRTGIGGVRFQSTQQIR